MVWRGSVNHKMEGDGGVMLIGMVSVVLGKLMAFKRSSFYGVSAVT